MPDKIDNLLPTAKEIQKQAALKEAEEARKYFAKGKEKEVS